MIKILSCKLNQSDEHIFKDPRLLPCGFTACHSCILRIININEDYNCQFCAKIHQISSIKKSILVENKTVLQTLEPYSLIIAKYSVKRLQEKIIEIECKKIIFFYSY